MDKAELKKIVDNTSEYRELKLGLSLRSEGVPASKWSWNNPEYADGVPVLARGKLSDSDPNIKTAFDNFTLIMNTKSGYMASNVSREYADDIADAVKDKYQEFDRLNNFYSKLTDLCGDCAGWGNQFSLCSLDANDQIRFNVVPASNAYVQYDRNGDPIYGIVIEKDGSKQKVWHYDRTTLTIYDGAALAVESSKPHGFTEVPLIEWMNNKERRGNAQKAVSLMDAYDGLVSDTSTEASALRSAYILLKNAGTIDDKTKADMKKTGIFALGGDADAKFITKNINPAYSELILKETWAGIWVVASSVDPKALSELSNATAFQIGQLYRLTEMDSMKTEVEFQKSLEFLDRVLKSYWTTLDTPEVGDYNTYDITYVFKRTVPQDVLADLEALQRAGGNLPQYFMFMRALGVDEKKARELAQESSEEMGAMLPSIEE